MGDQVVYRVTGGREVARALADVADDLDSASTMQRVADDGDRVVTGLVPKATGGLARSVRGASIRAGAQITLLKRQNIHASAFIRQADEELQPQSVRVLEQDINQKIRAKGLT